MRSTNDDLYITTIRLANLSRLIEIFPSRSMFCRAAALSTAHVSQLLTPTDKPTSRAMGPAFTRKLERTLELPAFCCDRERGVEAELGAVAERHKLPIPRTLQPRIDSNVQAMPIANGLTALEQATVDALIAAMRMGKVSQQECIVLLTKYVVAEEASPAQA